MKKSKRPVFKLNTSELPKNYKQPIKSKKRLGRGPRRIVRSRRRNEFIPEGADWCEINGAKLRQDIFFGEKRGRKFIPDGPLNFFVPSVPEGAGSELLEAPYGDGGDGGACGCACEGCVCGEGEGCACSGPGTDTGGDFGQGAQDGQQGQQSGQEGQQGQQQGQEGPSFSDPTGSTLSNDAFFGSGPSFSDPTGSTLSNDAFFGSGPSFSDPTGSTLSNDAFFGSGPSFSDPTGSTLSNDAFFGSGPSFSDPTGSTLSNDAFFGTGPAVTSDPSGRSGMDMDFDPHSIMDLPTLQDMQNMNPANPANPFDVPDVNTIGQLQGTGFLGAPGTFGPVTGPLDVGIPTNQSRGINPNDLPNLDPDMGLGKGFITDPTSAPQTPDAKGAIPATPADVKGIIDVINDAINAGQIGRAGAETLGKDQSQLGNPLSSVLSNPDPSQGNLNAAFQAAQNMNTQQAQNNPGLMAAMQSFANPEDPGAKGLPGLELNPEAPAPAPYAGAFVGPAPSSNPGWFTGEFGNPTMGLNAPTGFPGVMTTEQMTAQELGRQAEQTTPAQTITQAFDALSGKSGVNPSLVDEQGRSVFDPGIYAPDRGTDPGRTMDAPHNQPSISEFWEGTPSISRSAEVADPGRTMEAPHNQPSLDDLLSHMLDFQSQQEQGRDPSVPAYDLPSLDRGRTMDEPHTLPSLQELFDAREQQLAGRDFTAKEAQQEKQSQLEQQRSDRDVDKQERQALERAQERSAPPPSRGQERGSRGQERGTPLAPTSRGTPSLGRGPGLTSLGRGADRGLGRDSPGVQGLPAGLRGNDLAQALVSRGFDPNLVGAALTINDGGKMLSSMLEAAGLSHSQAMQTANAARGAVEAQHGLPSNRR